MALHRDVPPDLYDAFKSVCLVASDSNEVVRVMGLVAKYHKGKPGAESLKAIAELAARLAKGSADAHQNYGNVEVELLASSDGSNGFSEALKFAHTVLVHLLGIHPSVTTSALFTASTAIIRNNWRLLWESFEPLQAFDLEQVTERMQVQVAKAAVRRVETDDCNAESLPRLVVAPNGIRLDGTTYPASPALQSLFRAMLAMDGQLVSAHSCGLRGRELHAKTLPLAIRNAIEVVPSKGCRLKPAYRSPR